MKQNTITDKELKNLLRENGLKRTSAEFSNQLLQSVSGLEYSRPQTEFSAGRWLGKVVIAVLVTFNIVLFFYLNPFSIQPVAAVSLAAFTLGVWGVIVLFAKLRLEEPRHG